MDVVGFLNGWAQPWADFMWTRVFDSAVAFLAVAALWAIFRRRLSPHLGYCLFLLVLVKLLLPIEVALPRWIASRLPARPIARVSDWTRSGDILARSASGPSVEQPDPTPLVEAGASPPEIWPK